MSSSPADDRDRVLMSRRAAYEDAAWGIMLRGRYSSRYRKAAQATVWSGRSCRASVAGRGRRLRKPLGEGESQGWLHCQNRACRCPIHRQGRGKTPLAGLRVGFFSWQESNASCKPCFSGTVVLTPTMKQRRRKSAALLLSELPCRWPGWSFAGGFSPPAGWRESRPYLGRLGQLWLLVISLGVASPGVLTFGAALSLTG